MKKPLPWNNGSLGQRGMNCDDWPEDMSLLELKALLRTGVYTNIGINCNTTQSRRVCLYAYVNCLYIQHILTNILISFHLYLS